MRAAYRAGLIRSRLAPRIRSMTDLLMNPAIQAAVLPFLVAAVLAAALSSTRFLAVAVVSGVVVLLYLTVGFAFEPLTAVRKATLLIFASAALALALEASGVGPRKSTIAALALGASVGAVWAMQRVLEQQEPRTAWLAALGAMAYVALLVGGTLVVASNTLRGAVAGACVGLGNGLLAVLGASALLGQLGVALGTACAAVALVQMLRGKEAPAGWTMALPAAVGAALVGVLACATGELNWVHLLPLLLVAPACWLVPANAGRKPWQQAMVAGTVGMLPVFAAVAWALLSQRSVSPAG
jgi:hypothetical protein